MTCSPKAGGTYKWYIRDHLSTRAVYDEATASLLDYGHLPFGESWYGDSSEKWRFTNYERESDINQDYATFRQYQYAFGRFTAADPVLGQVGEPQSWNRYTYVENDAINFVDPMGRNAASLESFISYLEEVFGGGGGFDSDFIGAYDSWTGGCYNVTMNGMLLSNTCDGQGPNPETVDPVDPANNNTRQYLQCIADQGQAGSIQNLTNRPNTLLWGSLTGNDFSTVINIGLNNDRLGNSIQTLASNPTPANLLNVGAQALLSLRTGASRAALGENGAGTPYVKDFVRDPASASMGGKIAKGALEIAARAKLLWDAGATLRGIYVCAPVAVKQ